MINWSSLYSYVIRKGMILTWNHLDLILAEAILSVSVTRRGSSPNPKHHVKTMQACTITFDSYTE